MTVLPSDLATLLNDTTINTSRAQALITDAQTLCSSIVSPLPDTADVVVKRVAARAYVNSDTPRQQQLGQAGDPYALGMPTVEGVYLTKEDVADLRRFAGGGGAFSIDILPAGFVAPVDWSPDDQLADWDVPS